MVCSIKLLAIEVLWRNIVDALGVARRDVTSSEIDPQDHDDRYM